MRQQPKPALGPLVVRVTHHRETDMMKRFLTAAYVVVLAGACLFLWGGGNGVLAQHDALDFPAKILYVPMFHSRPLFLKNFRPELVSPVKKISINDPFSRRSKSSPPMSW